MKILKPLSIFFLCLGSCISIPLASAETLTQTFEGGMDLQITYPESVIIDRTFSITIHLENNGWENKQDISFVITNSDSAFKALDNETVIIKELTTTSSFGTYCYTNYGSK